LPGIQPFSSDTDGALAFGCTVPGHYSVMKGTFTIVP
jgi:azurin